MYQPLHLTLVDRFHPFLRFSLKQIFAAFPPPSVSKTQKLLSRTRRPKKELRSQKKKKQPSLPHKEQKTSSVSKQNAVAHVYQPHGTFIAFLFSFARMWFQSADFAFAFGLPVAVLSRVICELNFFDCEKRIGCAFPGTRRFSRLVQLGGGERFRSREAFGAHRAMFSRRNDIVWCSSVVLSMV